MFKRPVNFVWIIVGFTILFIRSYFNSFDLKALTSTETMSGLWNTQVYVIGSDIPSGTTKICTGINYVSINVSEYNEKELTEYNKNGVMYNQPSIYSDSLDPFSCTTIELEDNTVLEGINRDWGRVGYFIKFEDE